MHIHKGKHGIDRSLSFNHTLKKIFGENTKPWAWWRLMENGQTGSPEDDQQSLCEQVICKPGQGGEVGPESKLGNEQFSETIGTLYNRPSSGS
jgi:hypothetical protein